MGSRLPRLPCAPDAAVPSTALPAGLEQLSARVADVKARLQERIAQLMRRQEEMLGAQVGSFCGGVWCADGGGSCLAGWERGAVCGVADPAAGADATAAVAVDAAACCCRCLFACCLQPALTPLLPPASLCSGGDEGFAGGGGARRGAHARPSGPGRLALVTVRRCWCFAARSKRAR